MSKHTGQDNIKGILLTDLPEKSIWVKRDNKGVPEYFDITEMVMKYVGKEVNITLKEEKTMMPVDIDNVDEDLMDELEAKAQYWLTSQRAKEIAMLDVPKNLDNQE